MSDSKEVMIVEPTMNKPSLKPLYSADDMISFHKDITTLITKALERGQDYGTVKGIEKPFLFKSGAERLCKAFGASARYTIIDKEIDNDVEQTISTKYGDKKTKGAYTYTISCDLVGSSNAIIGNGIAIASTREKKWHHAPADNQNVVVKMAQKRALVAAVLNAFGLSDRFTQDEDCIHDYDKPNPSALKKTESKGYNPQDKSMQDWLIAQLESRAVPFAKWDDIGAALAGKSSTELDAVINQVLSK